MERPLQEFGKLEGKDHFKDLAIDVKIILKGIFKK
jgi:hypothetical protein